jgi:excisionase family DNA binding protein
VRDAARELGCSQDTIKRLVRRGKIRARKMQPGVRNSHLILNMMDVYAIAETEGAGMPDFEKPGG